MRTIAATPNHSRRDQRRLPQLWQRLVAWPGTGAGRRPHIKPERTSALALPNGRQPAQAAPKRTRTGVCEVSWQFCVRRPAQLPHPATRPDAARAARPGSTSRRQPGPTSTPRNCSTRWAALHVRRGRRRAQPEPPDGQAAVDGVWRRSAALRASDRTSSAPVASHAGHSGAAHNYARRNRWRRAPWRQAPWR